MTETYSPVIAQTLAHLDEFTEEELLHLNRLRVGQRVQSTAPTGKLVIGVLTKYNRKGVDVVTDQGESWTVAPGFLRPVE